MPLPPESLARALKQKARSLGFSLAGIAPAAPVPEASHYQDWLKAGYHGTMQYMERNRESRMDITRWDSAARSVLMLGWSYFRPGAEGAKEPGGARGRVARYASGRDYHALLRDKLEAIRAWMEETRPGAKGKIFVDTSPVLERLYARRAGIGWIGKNTMLISPRLGSYFFLCGLSLNIELPGDAPMPDHCGSCDRCLKACPTQAFPKPHTLDATKCISYLTIEHRGPIRESLRSQTGNWIFGCDVCQEVCPWNRFAEESAGGAEEDVLEAAPELKKALELSPEEFRVRHQRTPVERAKWAGWIRNALLAAGNSKDPALLPQIQKFQNHPDPVIREQASWSAARLHESPPRAPANL